ncbi:unnamed protein product [Effrenium voratum]|uniref:Uncharacterized protein n=1 Tax=Effrenium voratum TaxID=2562239 RepID=A0AA36N8W5_9DINO|nr:unnamed protein product [Effrenium voratum]
MDEDLHPANGQRFWWATFANALHAPWWRDLTAADTKHPELIKQRCEEVIRADEQRFGFTQFLLDANNAAPTCYYEAASQNLGGHQYMHNPDAFGYLQFAPFGSTEPCRNVFWLARFVLAQVYQAEVQFLMNEHLGNGSFTSNVADLLGAACTVSNACHSKALLAALSYVDLQIRQKEPGARSGSCVRYAMPGIQNSSWTGGPCFQAFVSYTIQSRRDPAKMRLIQGSIDEARLMSLPDVGQRWNSKDAGWLCLDEVYVREECLEEVSESSTEALMALQFRANVSQRISFDFHLDKTLTLTGLRNGVFDDVTNSLREALEGVRDCLGESLLLRFAIWFRFLVDSAACQVEASVNSGSAQLTMSTCGHFPLSATLFRGPGVQYDSDVITFSSCTHDVVCADLRFENKAGCNYNIWDVKTRARSETPVHINTPWVTVVTNASLLER